MKKRVKSAVEIQRNVENVKNHHNMSSYLPLM